MNWDSPFLSTTLYSSVALSDPPDPVESCIISNLTSDSIHVECLVPASLAKRTKSSASTLTTGKSVRRGPLSSTTRGEEKDRAMTLQPSNSNERDVVNNRIKGLSSSVTSTSSVSSFSSASLSPSSSPTFSTSSSSSNDRNNSNRSGGKSQENQQNKRHNTARQPQETQEDDSDVKASELDLKYRLEVYDSDQLSLLMNVSNEGNPSFLINGLTPQTTYVLMIYSENSLGKSTPTIIKSQTKELRRMESLTTPSSLVVVTPAGKDPFMPLTSTQTPSPSVITPSRSQTSASRKNILIPTSSPSSTSSTSLSSSQGNFLTFLQREYVLLLNSKTLLIFVATLSVILPSLMLAFTLRKIFKRTNSKSLTSGTSTPSIHDEDDPHHSKQLMMMSTLPRRQSYQYHHDTCLSTVHHSQVKCSTLPPRSALKKRKDEHEEMREKTTTFLLPTSLNYNEGDLMCDTLTQPQQQQTTSRQQAVYHYQGENQQHVLQHPSFIVGSSFAPSSSSATDSLSRLSQSSLSRSQVHHLPSHYTRLPQNVKGANGTLQIHPCSEQMFLPSRESSCHSGSVTLSCNNVGNSGDPDLISSHHRFLGKYPFL